VGGAKTSALGLQFFMAGATKANAVTAVEPSIVVVLVFGSN
jgi:hypothetical protein